MWFLGMDVGTGGTRAVVVDGEWEADSRGVERACALSHAASRLGGAGSRGLVARRAGGHSLALAAAPEPQQPIAAIGLTGQMHGAVMLDENGAGAAAVADLVRHADAAAVRLAAPRRSATSG